MPRLTLLLLLLSLLALPNRVGNGALPVVAALLSSDSGWEHDPNGSLASSDESPDRGWEMDPNG